MLPNVEPEIYSVLPINQNIKCVKPEDKPKKRSKITTLFKIFLQNLGQGLHNSFGVQLTNTVKLTIKWCVDSK